MCFGSDNSQTLGHIYFKTQVCDRSLCGREGQRVFLPALKCRAVPKIRLRLQMNTLCIYVIKTSDFFNFFI